MTTLKEVHEIAEKLHKGKTAIHLNVAIDAAIILANRVEELEAEAKEQKYVLRRARYTHKNRLIKQIEQRTEARVQELEDALKEQVEIAYRAGIEDGWENPDGNIENMAYEYLRYLEAK